MDIRNLKTFHMVVDLNGFQKAAEQLKYAQSTVTMQIQKLESELGVLLFERQGRKVTLTEAGRILYEQSKPILFDVERLKQSIQDIGSGYSGHIRMGCIEPFASLKLPAITSQFLDERPNVTISIEVGSAHMLNECVATGNLDFAISTQPSNESHLLFQPLFTEPLGLLLHKNHSLAVKEEITLNDLFGQRFVLTEQKCTIREVAERAFANQETEISVMFECGSLEVVKRMVQHQAGMAIVPQIIATDCIPGTIFKELSHANLHLTVGFVYRKDKHPYCLALQTFLNVLQNELYTEN
ncbi:LysR family transcriptional regulator [Bacillus sp. FJAT-47783]|uniref:LysR family transcriptional regulator n=1 Tax=Bacillus sp. FJAT-47783 TaxID=2922712 RepID=UPI001FABFC82|nr:LysR family transcriptional regulator [Bacillus sp. FJAT-47783]